MPHNKNRTLHILAAMLLLPLLPHADDDLALAKLADLSFGTIDFEGPTGTGNITMGSNGNLTYGSNTSGTGTGTPGQVQITGPEGTTVAISCSSEATLATGASTLPVTPVRFAIGSSNTGSYVGDIECSGIATTVATHTITATAAENTLFVGGSLGTNGRPLANGAYLGTNPGGNLPTFRVLVQ